MMRPNLVAWFVAAFFLVVGAVLTIAAPQLPVGPGLMVAALGLVAYLFVMTRRADRDERLLREGLRGEAQIVELKQTGMYVNDQPRVRLTLRVQAPGVRAFDAEDTYTVPLVALGALSSGGVLQVYLDRADSSRFTIDWFGGRRPALVSLADGPPIDVNATPEGREAVLELRRTHGIDLEAGLDLRGQPAARATVLDTLARRGIDLAHSEPTGAARDRLQKLKDLQESGLISDEEFEQHKARILDAI